MTLAPQISVQSELRSTNTHWFSAVQCNGLRGTCCCWAYIVVRKDIRDPLATMKELFVSFRFIVKPSSDNLRLITIFQNKLFILNHY